MTNENSSKALADELDEVRKAFGVATTQTEVSAERRWSAITKVQEFLAALARSPSPYSGAAGEAKGTYACPICGKETPHHHSDEQVAAHQEDQRRADGWISVANREPNVKGWYLTLGVEVDREQYGKSGDFPSRNARWSQLSWFLWVRSGGCHGSSESEIPEVLFYDAHSGGWCLRNLLGDAVSSGAESRRPVFAKPKFWRPLLAHPTTLPRDAERETIEWCAQFIESGAGMADLIDQDELDQQAKLLRALPSIPPREGPLQSATEQADASRDHPVREDVARTLYEIQPIEDRLDGDGKPISWQALASFCKELHYNQADAVLALLPSREGVDGWLPVYLYPDDNSIVLVANPDEGRMPVVAWKIEDKWFKYDLTERGPLDPQPMLWTTWPKLPKAALSPTLPRDDAEREAIKPHVYTPDYQAMGDCRVCGHGQNKPWHLYSPSPTSVMPDEGKQK